jgi:PIN domain nuclease of toxin-antitoxin system
MYLLDTCTLLWWLAVEERLPDGVRDVLGSSESSVYPESVTSNSHPRQCA